MTQAAVQLAVLAGLAFVGGAAAESLARRAAALPEPGDDAVRRRRLLPWPLTEAGLVAAAVLSSSLIGSFAAAAIALGLAWALLIVMLSDARDYIIPDVVSLPLILVGPPVAGGLAPAGSFVAVMGLHAFTAAIAGTVLWLIGFLFERLRGRAGLGLGDVKLFAAAGAWLGPIALPWALVAACAGVLLVTLPDLVRGRSGLSARRIPFGLYLAPAIWLAWVWQRLPPG